MSEPLAKEIYDKVTEQGNVVRSLKSGKAPKDDVDAAVKVLCTAPDLYKSF